MIKIKRAYDKATKDDGFRVLVDRLWPRGLTKDEARLDLWEREISPSEQLRRWFSHDPKKWVEFKAKYKAELKKKPGLLEQIRKLEREKGVLTLVYAAKDEKHNNAVVLQAILSA